MGSFPAVHYGSFGDEKVTSTSKIGGLPLGQKMELPDGRVFRHSRVGGTALVAGKLYQGKAQEAPSTAYIKSLVPNAAAVGATAINITTGAGTALAADVFQDGYLITASSIGTGIGYTYKVKGHLATAGTAAATVTINLYENDSVKVALESGTTTVGLRKNEYDGVLLTTADTVGVNTIAGVACATAAASTYVWLQRRGPAALFTDNTTLIVGLPVVASSTVAGAGAQLTGTAMAGIQKSYYPIGICMSVAASAEFSLVDLHLE